MKRTFTLDDTCVLWLPFHLHGLENTKMLDYSQYHNDGTRYGAIPTELGWSFDGVDDYVEVPFSQSLNLTTFTVVWWQYQKSKVCLSYPKLIDLPGVFNVHYDSACNWWTWTPDRDMDIGVPQDSVLNSWHQVALINNGAYYISYVDGVKKNSWSASPGNSTGGNLTINTSKYFNGTIGDVKVFNRALSQEEIQSTYNKERKIFGV